MIILIISLIIMKNPPYLLNIKDQKVFTLILHMIQGVEYTLHIEKI
jgi:hypothetical protein